MPAIFEKTRLLHFVRKRLLPLGPKRGMTIPGLIVIAILAIALRATSMGMQASYRLRVPNKWEESIFLCELLLKNEFSWVVFIGLNQ